MQLIKFFAKSPHHRQRTFFMVDRRPGRPLSEREREIELGRGREVERIYFRSSHLNENS